MLLAVFGATITSCKEDTQPRLEQPTEFILNTPPMASQTYILSEDSEGKPGEIYLTCSQPNYGMGVVTHYEVQVSDTEDFSVFQSLLTVNTQAKITCSDYEFAVAMNALKGVTSEDDIDKYDGSARDVYVRVRAYIPGCDYSSINSNVIKLNVKPYFAVRAPGKLYVIGDVGGWDINNKALYISESQNGIGSKIYSGVIAFTSEQAENGFRFYTELGSWGDDGKLPSIGSNANDGDNLTISLDENGEYSGPCVAGKGNWKLSGWAGGDLKLTVDLNTMKVYIEKAN